MSWFIWAVLLSSATTLAALFGGMLGMVRAPMGTWSAMGAGLLLLAAIPLGVLIFLAFLANHLQNRKPSAPRRGAAGRQPRAGHLQAPRPHGPGGAQRMGHRSLAPSAAR